MSRTLYEVLGVSPGVTSADIDVAYESLLGRVHNRQSNDDAVELSQARQTLSNPNASPFAKRSASKYIEQHGGVLHDLDISEITRAYTVLSNPIARAKYDDELARAPRASLSFPGSGENRPSTPAGVSVVRLPEIVIEGKARSLVMLQRQYAWRFAEVFDQDRSSLSPEFTFELEYLALYLAETVIMDSEYLHTSNKIDLTQLLVTGYVEFNKQFASASATGLKGMAMKFLNTTGFAAKWVNDEYENFKRDYDYFMKSAYRVGELSGLDDLTALFTLFIQRVRNGRALNGQPMRAQPLTKAEGDAFMEQLLAYITEVARSV